MGMYRPMPDEKTEGSHESKKEKERDNKCGESSTNEQPSKVTVTVQVEWRNPPGP
jgi:hypothetical protein